MFFFRWERNRRIDTVSVVEGFDFREVLDCLDEADAAESFFEASGGGQDLSDGPFDLWRDGFWKRLELLVESFDLGFDFCFCLWRVRVVCCV